MWILNLKAAVEANASLMAAKGIGGGGGSGSSCDGCGKGSGGVLGGG